MPPSPCLGCGKVIPPGNSRCPPCRSAHSRSRDAQRGTRQERGLGRDHEVIRAELLATATVCAMCGLPPTPTDPLTAGHIRARANGGTNEASNYQAEHASCNYGKGSR
jgi:5-methylcytosine-specific restriction protein A